MLLTSALNCFCTKRLWPSRLLQSLARGEIARVRSAACRVRSAAFSSASFPAAVAHSFRFIVHFWTKPETSQHSTAFVWELLPTCPQEHLQCAFQIAFKWFASRVPAKELLPRKQRSAWPSLSPWSWVCQNGSIIYKQPSIELQFG